MSGVHDDIVGTWILIRTVPAELPMDGPGSADPWLGRPMDPPTEVWEPASPAAVIADLVREHTAPPQPSQEAEGFLLEPLRAAVRVELSEETIGRVLADHRTAVVVDGAIRRHFHETSGHPLAEPETEGLIVLHAVGVRSVDGAPIADNMMGDTLRLSDGEGLRDREDFWPEGTGPGGARLVGAMLKEQLAGALHAAGTPGANGYVEAASLAVSDLRNGRLRWVIVEGAAGQAWRDHADHMIMVRQLIPVARVLSAMTEERFAQLPVLGGDT